jgi:hypothetical protein
LYQADKIFVDCFELYSDFVALSMRKSEVKGKYRRAAQEKKRKQKKK